MLRNCCDFFVHPLKTMKFLEPQTTISPEPDILHPDDGQYIWLPISVLVGIFVLAALVRYRHSLFV